MTDTRRHITLGQALNRQDETDSSIASELYVPGYRNARISGRNVATRVEEVAADAGQDVIGVVTNEIHAKYTEPNMEANNPFGARRPYADINKLENNESAETIQKALTRMDSQFVKENPAADLEFGQGNIRRTSPLLDVEKLESFKQSLLVDVLKDANVFNPSDPFFVPNAPNEKESFPQGMFSFPKGTSDKPYGRYNKSERSSLSKNDIAKATGKMLDVARNDYITPSALPKIPANNLKMSVLLSEGFQVAKTLRLDGNDNIYKAKGSDDDGKPISLDLFGAGNKPESGFNPDDFQSFVDSVFEVDEFNKFFQYGTVGVVIKASVYMLAAGTACAAFLAAVLNIELNPNNNLSNNLLSLAPPTLLRLKNELGLNGQEIDLDDGSVWEKTKQFTDRMFQGWRVLFGYYEEDGSSFLTTLASSVIPNKVAQSPQFHFSLARGILRELQEVGNDPAALFARVVREPSSSLCLRITAIMYKLGIKVEAKTAPEEDYKPLQEIEDLRKNRHRIFDSRKKSSDYFNPLSLKYFDYLSLRDSIKEETFVDGYSNVTASTGSFGRISKDQVVEIEKKIDADYVPFSIQDLRTNEVMALPAFIDSVSDSFSVNYESTHGYGRTDPIYTYSKTERSVELSFNLVAMNHNDHDRMYEIVNKLTSMCYPQRSRGQLRVKDNNQSFYQPFSQIQTASPLIRIRLGNVMHSNVSERGYKQLFGNLLGEKFIGAEGTRTREITQLEAEKTKLEAEIALLKELKNQFEQGAPDTVLIPVETNEGNISATNLNALRVDLNSRITIGAGLKLQVSYSRTTRRGVNLYKIVNNSIPKNGKFKNYLKNPRFNDMEFVIAESSLQFDDSEITRLETQLLSVEEKIKKILSTPAYTPIDEKDFLSASSNPIVRSFESVQGKGLACFIKSLSFDYNNVPWNTHKTVENDRTKVDFDKSETNIAPMRIKVSMSLAPIHDMPLGLSYDGTIMAPSHPVGKWALANLPSSMTTSTREGQTS